MDPNVLVAADEVIKLIEIQLNTISDQNQRLKAYQAHEEFKRNSPFTLCLEVGLFIFDKRQKLDIPVRLCGLQLIEWFVQNSWDNIEQTWRDQMKMKAIRLIEMADFKDHDCLKGGVVKVVVEIIKRSWPQQWVTLFEDLSKLQSLGNAQLELVLIVLMRLSEDLNGFDEKVKHQRRKDMVSTLNNHLHELFRFFISTIHDNVVKLKESDIIENQRISVAALNTIAEFAGWVNFEFLLIEEKILFKVLFWLLEIDRIKFSAAHCLCSIFERKTQPEKRIEMMVILSEDALSIIEKMACNAALKASQGHADEYRYLKKISEMLSHFGRCQIAVLWGDDKGFKERPKSFDRFLKLMLDFTQHEALAVNTFATKLWTCFSNHKLIVKDEMFRSAIEFLPEEILRIMSRLASPDLTENPGTQYTLMELDDSEDFVVLHEEGRQAGVGVLKQIASIIPNVVLSFIYKKAKEYLQMQIPGTKSMSPEQISSSKYYMLWDTYQHFCKIFFITFFKGPSHLITEDVVQNCNELLNSLINYSVEHSMFLTLIISVMQSLFSIFKYSDVLLKPTLQKLSNIVLSHGQDRKLKRHAVVVITTLCKRSPELLIDMFDDLLSFFSAKMGENMFTNYEKRLLIEGLLCISKLLPDVSKRNMFINEVFEKPCAFFKSSVVKDICKNTNSFIKFLGFDLKDDDEGSSARRNELTMMLYTLQAAAQALKYDNGDNVNDYPGDNEISQMIANYPWMQLMIDTLPYLFDIAKQICLLWTKVNEQPESFKEILMQENNEIHNLVTKKTDKIEEDDDTKNKKTNRQFPVFALHEVIYTTLALYGQSLGPVFFALPGMMNVFIEKVVKSWVHYPNYRMRKVWRTVVKAFLLNCPAKYYEPVLAGFVATSLKQMFERLSREWLRVQGLAQGKKYLSDDEIDENESDQSSEIIELRTLYNLSKEVLDVLISSCLYKRGKICVKQEENVIGNLGEFLLKDPRTNLQLISLFFTALTWPDGSIIDRLCNGITVIVKKMFTPENPVNSDIPNQMMVQLLQGLQIHGGDQTVQASIVNTTLSLYLQLRLQYPDIIQVLTMVPSCPAEELKNFDLAVFMYDSTLSELAKRKRFRKLLQGAIGKTISELHKRDYKIQDLPPLAPRVKPLKPDVIADAEDAGICQLFVPDQ